MLTRKPTQAADEKAEIRSKVRGQFLTGGDQGSRLYACQIEAIEELYSSGLRDWAAIRAHLKRHDAAMVKDYEDDINTMLVFVSNPRLHAWAHAQGSCCCCRPVCSQRS